MGIWAPGLYSSDLALDLRPLVAVLARLPVPDGDIRRYASDASPGIADAPANEEYSTFWLVLADQFAKKGIDCPFTRQRALDIIVGGTDIAMMRELGMTEQDLRKRQQNLDAVRAKILAAADAPKPARKVLQKPLAFIMETGECFAYPTQRGRAINPYFPSKEAQDWTQDGWGAALVLESGRTLDYLVWYRLVTVERASTEKPTLEDVREGRIGGGVSPGTCSPARFKRMELERIGALELREAAVQKALQGMSASGSGDMAAIHDICVSNTLGSLSGNVMSLALGEHFGTAVGPPVTELM